MKVGKPMKKISSLHKNKYNFDLYQSENYLNQPLISVITPVYNNEKTIKHTIESVLNQSIMPQIEYIIVDDGSKDQTRSILKTFVKEHPNIKLAFLAKNSGTPAYPRNLGIELSTAPYLTFLDADDWFEKTGLEKLYSVLNETDDDYVVGKTIRVTSNKSAIVAEHESWKERRSIPPTSIPHIFHHLGPRARLMKASIVKDNQIKFPEMKYAEDKQFFMELLTNCKKISTTKAIIYYLNRLDENNESLTKQTNVLNKMHCNRKVIHYFKKKEMDAELKKMIFNRLYEFDCFNGFMNRYHTLGNENTQTFKGKIDEFLKRKAYIATMKKILRTTSSFDYEISDHFHHPYNVVCYQLFQQKRYKDIETLFKWMNQEKNKKHIVKKGTAYWATPLSQPYNYIKVPMYAELVNCEYTNGFFRFDIGIAGDYPEDMEQILFRDRNNMHRQYFFQIEPYEGALKRIMIPEAFFASFRKSVYTIYLSYRDYHKVQLHIPNPKLRLKKRQTDKHHFYKTIHNHLALKVLG